MTSTKSTWDRQGPLTGVSVGCGFFSRIQMEAWPRVNGARIVAACDLDLPTVEHFSADVDLRPYRDLDEVLVAERPDFVDIATRPASHRGGIERASSTAAAPRRPSNPARSWAARASRAPRPC